MLIQQIAPVAATEFAPVFVALELSRSKWLVGVGTPQKWAVRRHQVGGGDLDALLALLSRVAAGEEKRSGLPAKVHVCFEAGRDGHWLYRALKSAGYAAYEIEPASVAVDRRARRVKSDGVDVDKLVRTLARFVRGELDACRMVEVPSEAEEDAKRPHREYERLVKEQTSHRNRIKALLFGQGVPRFRPNGAGAPGAPVGVADPVPQHMRRHALGLQRRACLACGAHMLGQQRLDSVGAEPLPCTLGNSADAPFLAGSRSHTWRALRTCVDRGVHRSFRPLPTHCT